MTTINVPASVTALLDALPNHDADRASTYLAEDIVHLNADVEIDA